MTYIYIGGVIVFGTLLGIVAYLYREGAIIQGRTEIGLGPLKIKLNGKKRPDSET